MATATINPLGAVAIADGGVPRTFQATARETISGGDFVYSSGAAAGNVVGSQASSYVTGDIEVALCNVWSRVNGIALNNAGSGELVTIATRGMYLLQSAGVTSGGMLVTLVSGSDGTKGFDGVVSITPDESAGSTLPGVIGRALTSAGSEGYCLVSLNL
jgi:hypothetical protein